MDYVTWAGKLSAAVQILLLPAHDPELAEGNRRQAKAILDEYRAEQDKTINGSPLAAAQTRFRADAGKVQDLLTAGPVA